MRSWLIFLMGLMLAGCAHAPDPVPGEKPGIFEIADRVLGKSSYYAVVIPREDVDSGNLGEAIRSVADLFAQAEHRVVRVAIASRSGEATAHVVREAFRANAGKRLARLHLLYLGGAAYSEEMRGLCRQAHARYSFKERE